VTQRDSGNRTCMMIDDCLALRTEIVQLRWLGGSTSGFGDLIDASAWTH